MRTDYWPWSRDVRRRTTRNLAPISIQKIGAFPEVSFVSRVTQYDQTCISARSRLLSAVVPQVLQLTVRLDIPFALEVLQ